MGKMQWRGELGVYREEKRGQHGVYVPNGWETQFYIYIISIKIRRDKHRRGRAEKKPLERSRTPMTWFFFFHSASVSWNDILV